MRVQLKIVCILMFCLSLIVTTGCAKKVPKSGFLSDYSAFREGPRGGADWIYIGENVNFKSYNKIMMDHVVFYFSGDSKYKGIHPDVLKELADAFHKAMVEALANAYPFVEEPGPGVMRVRAAITGVEASKPVLNTISTVMPIGLGISILKKGVTGEHTGVGKASIEVEILDSQSDERLAAAIDTKAGEKYKVVEGMSKWGHAKDAFKFWAERFRQRLDEFHSKE